MKKRWSWKDFRRRLYLKTLKSKLATILAAALLGLGILVNEAIPHTHVELEPGTPSFENALSWSGSTNTTSGGFFNSWSPRL